MKKGFNIARLGLIIASAALMISIINIIISSFAWNSITMFLCMIVIFIANLLSFLEEKKKDGSNQK